MLEFLRSWEAHPAQGLPDPLLVEPDEPSEPEPLPIVGDEWPDWLYTL